MHCILRNTCINFLRLSLDKLSFLFFVVSHFYLVCFLLSQLKSKKEMCKKALEKLQKTFLNSISWRVCCILVSPCTFVRCVTKSTVCSSFSAFLFDLLFLSLLLFRFVLSFSFLLDYHSK